MYDPKVARFLQEDTYTGTADDPLSLNLYTYVKNNPLIYWDPTGHLESMVSLWSYNFYNSTAKSLGGYNHSATLPVGWSSNVDPEGLKTQYYVDTTMFGGSYLGTNIIEYSNILLAEAIRRSVSLPEAYRQIYNHNAAPDVASGLKDAGIGSVMSFVNGGLFTASVVLTGLAVLTDQINYVTTGGYIQTNYGGEAWRDTQAAIDNTNNWVRETLPQNPKAYDTGEVTTDLIQLAFAIHSAAKALKHIDSLPGAIKNLFKGADDIYVSPSTVSGYNSTVSGSSADIVDDLSKLRIWKADDVFDDVFGGIGKTRVGKPRIIGQLDNFGKNDLVLGLEDYYQSTQKRFGGKTWDKFGINYSAELEEQLLEAMQKSDKIRFVIDDVRFTDVSAKNSKIFKGETTNFELFQIRKNFSHKTIFVDKNGNIFNKYDILKQINIKQQ